MLRQRRTLTTILVLMVGMLATVSVSRVKGAEPMTYAQVNNDPPAGWETWSPRAEITPQLSVDKTGGRDGKEALRIGGGGNPAAFGGWRKRVDGIKPGKTYRLTGWYRAEGIAQTQRSVAARLDWLNDKGQRVSAPDYAFDTEHHGKWTKIEYTATAPEYGQSVLIELSLAWASGGTVWWDDVTLTEVAPAKERTVRVATVYLRPRDTGTAEKAVAAFQKVIEDAATQRPDIICLPEAITLQGTGLVYADVSEPIPGPTTKTLGELARKLHTYIVAGIIERDGKTIYNTAIMVDREGKLAGTYRKTHLPREEVEGGITPGNTYPVFKTDFGTVGLMICWDVQFPEPARALALKGAELIVLPIAGGSDILARARAIENHLFLVSSSYDMRSFVVDPTGAVLTEATKDHAFALTEINLDHPIQQPWLGDMKPRTWKERRPDIPVEVSGARH